ncbi:acyl-CoA dehydrogenase [Pseudomonas sp. NFX15]|uniref:acyl-CoA dehydrogenase n=1 Tax=Pseudomonas sp. NFX15 TaxID=2816958 RepID=UPI003B8B1883
MGRSVPLENLLETFSSRPVARAAETDLQPVMQALARNGWANLPMPGQGRTLERWRALAKIAGCDLALVKLFEGHTDALAILAELEPGQASPSGCWGVWAAEPPFARVTISDRQQDQVYLQGRKAWCSGAALLDGALVTAWDEQQRPQMVAVQLQQPAIRISDEGWQAVGMGSSASLDVMFDGAVGRCIGAPGEYLSRPGFWQGGGGIAACWYGAACGLAHYLREHCTKPHHDVHADVHLGAVEVALGAAAASLRETANWIDCNPGQSAEIAVRRVRAQVEVAVHEVLAHVGRALGATPFCRNSHFARLAADLPVFLRQSHAEKDLAALGELIATQPSSGWLL